MPCCPDGKGVSFHQGNMANEIYLLHESKDHKLDRQLEGEQCSKLKNQYGKITLDSRNSASEIESDSMHSPSQCMEDRKVSDQDWQETKLAQFGSSDRPLEGENGLQIAMEAADLQCKKGNQIAVSKQDSLKCESGRPVHCNRLQAAVAWGSGSLPDPNCTEGNFQDGFTKNDRIDLSETTKAAENSEGTNCFHSKLKPGDNGIGNQGIIGIVFSASLGAELSTGMKEDLQCEKCKATPEEECQVKNPIEMRKVSSEDMSTRSFSRHGDNCSLIGNENCCDKEDSSFNRGSRHAEENGNMRNANQTDAGCNKDIAVPDEAIQKDQSQQPAAREKCGENLLESPNPSLSGRAQHELQQNPPVIQPAQVAQGVVLRRRKEEDPGYLNYSSKTIHRSTGVKLRSGARARRDPRLRYSASDIETLKKRYVTQQCDQRDALFQLWFCTE